MVRLCVAVTALLVLPAAAGAASTAYDGIYRAEIQGTGGNCKTFMATVRVAEGKLTFRISSTNTIDGGVNQDGTFSVSGRQTLMTGKIADGALVGGMTTYYCQYRFTLPKQ